MRFLPSQVVSIILAHTFLPPATKLGQCYIFTGVCDSVNRGGVRGCCQGAFMVAPRGMRGCSGGGQHAWLLLGGMRGCYRGGMCGCSRGGVHGCSGGCMVAPGGHAWLLPGGRVWLLLGGHAWLLWRGACVGYDKIRRYDQ